MKSKSITHWPRFQVFYDTTTGTTDYLNASTLAIAREAAAQLERLGHLSNPRIWDTHLNRYEQR